MRQHTRTGLNGLNERIRRSDRISRVGVARDRDKPRDSIPFGIEKIRDISFAHNNFNSRTNSSDDALNMKDRRWKNWAVRDSGFSCR